MSVPKYYEMYRELLGAVKDGRVYGIGEYRAAVAERLKLTAEDLAEMVPSKQGTLFHNRLNWTKTYLVKAGLLSAPKRAAIQITAEGGRVLKEGAAITDAFLAELSPAFRAFKNPGSSEVSYPEREPNAGKVSEPRQEEETPQESIELAYRRINSQLADELLAAIMDQPPAFFENLVVELMSKMGYGTGLVTKYSGDGGIDGVMNEDKLGFNQIYIQAKRWAPESTIGRPELQKFVGAMAGPPKIEKGLFITTARFSGDAESYAKSQHIILVNGERLTELMIEHGVGVSEQKTYTLKRLDSDYFQGLE